MGDDLDSSHRLGGVLGAKLQITDEALLDHLVHLGFVAETAAAFEVLPLLEVAWADGSMDDEEYWRVLGEATAFGVELGGPAHAILEVWLKCAPDRELFEAWHRVAAARRSMDRPPPYVDCFLEGAQDMTEAARDLLDFRPISGEEGAVIGRVQEALRGEARPRARSLPESDAGSIHTSSRETAAPQADPRRSR